jgi:hypothetical protein
VAQCHVRGGSLNRTTRGFWNYFRRGTVSEVLHDLDQYLWMRMVIWAKRKAEAAKKTE